MNKLIIVAAAALLAAPSVYAAPTGGLSYTYAQAAYVNVESDDNNNDLESDGFSIGGSVLIAPQFFIFGNYSMVESDDFNPGPAENTAEIDFFDAGLGFRTALGPQTDFTAQVAYVSADVEFTGPGTAGFSGDDNGFQVGAGARHLFTPMWELNGGVTYTEFSDDDDGETAFTIGGLVHFNPVSVLASYTNGEDGNAVAVGARFNF